MRKKYRFSLPLSMEVRIRRQNPGERQKEKGKKRKAESSKLKVNGKRRGERDNSINAKNAKNPSLTLRRYDPKTQ